MEIDWPLKLILLVLLLLLSAFFSGSEVALFSLDKRKVKKLFKPGSLTAKYIKSLLDFPRRLLVTILIGNTLANVAASIIAVTLALDFAALNNISIDLALTVQIILLTILIILLSELIPKIIATKNPVTFSRGAVVPLYWISVILYPAAESVSEFVRALVGRIKIDRSKSVLLREELSELANLGQESGAILEEEQGIINSIVDFKTLTVSEVMTPRVDIVSIPIDAEFEEVLKIISNSGHSRLPLYKENLDEIIGILYAKDLLQYLKSPVTKRKLPLHDIARKAMFVPETKLINSLLREFQEKKTHIAIAVDEYGGTAGLITLEDIIEEVIGEIRDEYDKEEAPIVQINENKYSVLGKLPINELDDFFHLGIKKEDAEYDTLGGFVYHQAGTIPKEGYSFKIKNYKFTVSEIFKKRINKVLIEKIEDKN